MSACWMWRGCASSCRYSVTSLSERWRPNHVFHQNRNGIRTISQPVTRKRIRLRVDMLARGFAECSLEVVSAGFTDTTGNYTLFDYVRIEDAVLLEVMRDGVL